MYDKATISKTQKKQKACGLKGLAHLDMYSGCGKKAF